MSEANKRQVAGEHYRVNGAELQHWDIVEMFRLDYFQGQVTKYLFRWRHKNGVEDLEKAAHYLEKYIELEKAKELQTKIDTDVSKVTSIIKEPEQTAWELDLGAEIYYRIGYELGQVKATGWTNYVFEGAHQEGYLFTCKECGAKFHAPPDYNPHNYHPCNGLAKQAHIEGDATPAYVNQ